MLRSVLKTIQSIGVKFGRRMIGWLSAMRIRQGAVRPHRLPAAPLIVLGGLRQLEGRPAPLADRRRRFIDDASR